MNSRWRKLIQVVLLSYFKVQDKTTVYKGTQNKLAWSVGRRYEHDFLNSSNRNPQVNVKASTLKWVATHSLLQVMDGYISEAGLDWEI